MESVNFPERDQEGEDHRKPTKDGSGDEIRGEDGCVPPGNNGCGEIERHHAMN